MADKTHIQWTEATWNPITGCSIVSPGCTNCYAMKLAGTRLAHHPSRQSLTREVNGNHVWTGEVRFNEQWLTQPLHWKRPRMIFVCAHADLFHEAVPDDWIDQIFAVMALTPHHTYQILTKRADRMRDYMSAPDRSRQIACAVLDTMIEGKIPKGYINDKTYDQRWPVCADDENDVSDVWLRSWPLPNVWLGVSVEDQARADERIPPLLGTPASLRWVSAEPLLGPVDLTDVSSRTVGGDFGLNALNGLIESTKYAKRCKFSGRIIPHSLNSAEPLKKLDWVVVGGESGPRPMHPDWARSLRDQCADAGVPFFFKQWGSWAHMPGRAYFKDAYKEPWKRVDSQISQVRPALMVRVGKTAAGDVLDGVQHHNWPEVKHL